MPAHTIFSYPIVSHRILSDPICSPLFMHPLDATPFHQHLSLHCIIHHLPFVPQVEVSCEFHEESRGVGSEAWDMHVDAMLKRKKQISGTQTQAWRQRRRVAVVFSVYQIQKTNRNINMFLTIIGTASKTWTEVCRSQGKPTQITRLEKEFAIELRDTFSKPTFGIYLDRCHPMVNYGLFIAMWGKIAVPISRETKLITMPPQFYTNPCKMT